MQESEKKRVAKQRKASKEVKILAKQGIVFGFEATLGKARSMLPESVPLSVNILMDVQILNIIK